MLLNVSWHGKGFSSLLNLLDKRTLVDLIVGDLPVGVVVADNFVVLIYVHFLIDCAVSEQLPDVGITLVIDCSLHEVSVVRLYTVVLNQELDDLRLLVSAVASHLDGISVFQTGSLFS